MVDPAENALFAGIFPRNVRERINGLRLALQEGGKVVAPLLGAGLFALVGGGAVAGLDAATFVIAAAAVWRLEFHEAVPAPPARSWQTQLAAGVRHILDDPVLRTTTITAAIAMVVAGIATPASTPWSKRSVDTPATSAS